MKKRVLVVAAHPDDEALGCGGTLASHTAEGDTVWVLFMTNGVGARSDIHDGDAGIRNDAAERARQILGVAKYIYNNYPDNQLDTLPLLEITKAVESVISEFRPDIVYTHHNGDLNIDHRRTHEAVLTACRPQPSCSVKAIYTFEVLSATEWNAPTLSPFLPNYFVDISSFLTVKIAAIDAYSLEMKAVPHSRNIEHVEYLAKHRGHSIGVNSAESFIVIRLIR